MNEQMVSSIKEIIYFDLDFAACGFESFKMNMINVIPKFFEVVDKIPSKTLILSYNSRISSLFFNYCLFKDIPGKVLYYPQTLILYLTEVLKRNSINTIYTKDKMVTIKYPHTICFDSKTTVKDDEIWFLHSQNQNKVLKQNHEFTVIKFLNF
jgi:hypothetical protein